MKLLLGVVLGVGLCAVWPELPRAVSLQVHDLAQSLADHTKPGVVEQGVEAWTDWRKDND